MSQNEKETFEKLITQASKAVHKMRKQGGLDLFTTSFDPDQKEIENESEGVYPEELIKTLLEKKYNLFLLRKLRVGNQETLNIFTFPLTIEKLINLLCQEEDEIEGQEAENVDPKKNEYPESAQLILSTGRREISQLLAKDETDFLLILFRKMVQREADRKSSDTISLHFSKILSGQLDYNYCETAQYINSHPEYLSYLVQHLGSKGVFDLFFELLSLYAKQHNPKIEWISQSIVIEFAGVLLEELDKVIALKKNPEPGNEDVDLSPKVGAIIQLSVYLFEVAPDIAYPLFSYEILSPLVSKIIESDFLSDFYQFLEKLIDINTTLVKRSGAASQALMRNRLATTSLSSFSTWTGFSNFMFPLASVLPQQSSEIDITESMQSILSTSNYVGQESIPICVLEKGELVPVVVKQLLLCLPRMKFRLYRYHPLDTLAKASIPSSYLTLGEKEAQRFEKLHKRLLFQKDKFLRQQKKLEQERKEREKEIQNTQNNQFVGSGTTTPPPEIQPETEVGASDDDNITTATTAAAATTTITTAITTLPSLDSHQEKKNTSEEKTSQQDYNDITGNAKDEQDDKEQQIIDEDKLILVVVPLGLQRWSIVRIVLNLISTGYHCVDDSLVNSRILLVCVGLFLSHNCSNILHCTIVEMFYQIFQKNHMPVIQQLIEEFNLPGQLIEAYEGLPQIDDESADGRKINFVTFREHLMIVIALVSKENRYAQNLLSHHERWKQFVARIQPQLARFETENFFKKNTHRLMPHV